MLRNAIANTLTRELGVRHAARTVGMAGVGIGIGVGVGVGIGIGGL